MPANAIKKSNKLQVMLHVRHVVKRSEENLVEHMSSKCEDELTGTLCSREGLLGFWVEQIVPHRLDMGMVLGI